MEKLYVIRLFINISTTIIMSAIIADASRLLSIVYFFIIYSTFDITAYTAVSAAKADTAIYTASCLLKISATTPMVSKTSSINNIRTNTRIPPYQPNHI